MKEVIVTTSWDDGDPQDMRIADLLSGRAVPGTFYVPILGYRGRTTLTTAQTRELSVDGFEIGGHTYSHAALTDLRPSELDRELVESRKLLQDRSGQQIMMFCYPNGRYDEKSVQAVKTAGYLGARTTRMLRTDVGSDPYRIPTTVQAYPHPPMAYLKNGLKGQNVGSLVQYSLELAYSMDWVQFSKTLFDKVLQDGGVWHLYGHSWEIGHFDLWAGLEEVLSHVSGRKGVQYLTNGELATRYFSNSKDTVAKSA